MRWCHRSKFVSILILKIHKTKPITNRRPSAGLILSSESDDGPGPEEGAGHWRERRGTEEGEKRERARQGDAAGEEGERSRRSPTDSEGLTADPKEPTVKSFQL